MRAALRVLSQGHSVRRLREPAGMDDPALDFDTLLADSDGDLTALQCDRIGKR